MPIYELAADALLEVQATTFAAEGIREREDLQRLLRDDVGIIAPDTLAIAEEFSRWADSSRRIDLLGVDRDGNLVVIELKRTWDGGHMDLQAIRYAAMVAPMGSRRRSRATRTTCRGGGAPPTHDRRCSTIWDGRRRGARRSTGGSGSCSCRSTSTRRSRRRCCD